MDIPLSGELKKKLSVNQLAKLIFRLGKENRILIMDGKSLLDKLSPPEKAQAESPINDRNDKEFCLKFYEAIAWLKRRGLLMDIVDPTGYGDTLEPHLRPTSVWEMSSLDDAGIIMLIDDLQETVNSLKKEIRNLDDDAVDIVAQYYWESLRACQEGLYISSAICLGAASEKTIDCLGKAISERYPQKHNVKDRGPADLTKYLLANNALCINQIFDPVTKDKAFKRDFTAKLQRMEYIYRLNRNEAGHPESIPETTEYEQVCFLVSFRKYAKTISKAIRLLKSNP